MTRERVTIHLSHETGASTGEVIIEDRRNVEDARNELLKKLADHFEVLVRNGCSVTVRDSVKRYQIDESSRLNIVEAAVAASVAMQGVSDTPWPLNFFWIAADNSEQPMDAADCVSWAQTVKAYWGGLVRANRTMKNAISALTTLSDCEAFDVTTGWPVN